MFYIGDKKIDLEINKLEVLGEGDESVVRKFDKFALKFYRDYCKKDRLNEESVEYLKGIYTYRFILPEEHLYSEEHEFIGCASRYLDFLPLEDIEKLSVSKLVTELKLLRNDVIKLSSNNIDIDDLNRNNIIFDGDSINISDVGSFLIKDVNDGSLEFSNMEKLDQFMIRDIIMPISYKQNIGKKSKAFLEQMETNGYEYIEDFIEDTGKDDINFKTYVKHMLSCK